MGFFVSPHNTNIVQAPNIAISRSTFSISNKLFNGDEGPFKRMRFSEDSEKTQWRRVSRCHVTMLQCNVTMMLHLTVMSFRDY